MNNEGRNELTHASFLAKLRGPLGAQRRNKLTCGCGRMVQRQDDCLGRDVTCRGGRKSPGVVPISFWTLGFTFSPRFELIWVCHPQLVSAGREELDKLASFSRRHLRTQRGQPLSVCSSATAPEVLPPGTAGTSASKADAQAIPAKALH